MAETTNKHADYITEMYNKNLASQEAQLKTDYDQNAAQLEYQQRKTQKQADANLTRTYVEAAKNARNYAETQNAYGMSSGTMAQAKLAQNNQMQRDMTAIRTAQQTVEAEIQKEKDLLAKEYAAAITKARSENNMALAQALYQQAQSDEDALLQKQKEAAALMASAGDYSLYKALYGLTDEQIAKLQGGTVGRKGGGSQTPKADKTIISGSDIVPAPAPAPVPAGNRPAITPTNGMFTEQKMLN